MSQLGNGEAGAKRNIEYLILIQKTKKRWTTLLI
jgi:hypothetical protein